MRKEIPNSAIKGFNAPTTLRGEKKCGWNHGRKLALCGWNHLIENYGITEWDGFCAVGIINHKS